MHTDFRAKIVLDSIAPCGVRLTTMEWTYPRFIHSEFMTHRDRERNAASSRAIPWPKMMTAITEKPVIPIFWGKEQKGMQTGEEIDCPGAAEIVWLNARDQAVCSAQALANLGVHKSLCNRLTEPFMYYGRGHGYGMEEPIPTTNSPRRGNSFSAYRPNGEECSGQFRSDSVSPQPTSLALRR